MKKGLLEKALEDFRHVLALSDDPTLCREIETRIAQLEAHLSRKDAGDALSVSEFSEQYMNLREAIISFSVEKISSLEEIRELGSQESSQVWGVLMDIRVPEQINTVVCLIDGTTSVYAGKGASLTGIGEHPEVARISKSLLALVEDSFHTMTPTMTFPLPSVGRVTFYVFTLSGVFTADVDLNDLTNETHELSPLFLKVQEIFLHSHEIMQEYQSHPPNKSG